MISSSGIAIDQTVACAHVGEGFVSMMEMKMIVQAKKEPTMKTCHISTVVNEWKNGNSQLHSDQATILRLCK